MAFEHGKLTAEKISISDLPLRLLLITDSGSRIRLVELPDLKPSQREEISTSGFAALSYCWGGDQAVKLTKDTITRLRRGIATRELPKSLADAVWAAGSIRLSYIWIDALCIKQDDKTDKELEIAKMSTYYSASTVALCAASASGCEEGFLEARSGTHYVAGPFQLPCLTGDGTGSILLYKESESQEPTTKRAWTLQESLLSRRILVFSSKKLYWCCAVANAGCGGPHRELANRIMGDPESLVPGIYPLKVLEKLPPAVQWSRITQDFMKRSLGLPDDKLLAISAIATVMHQLFTERIGDVVYLAGLFISLSDLMEMSEQLLWYTEVHQSRRARRYRAPSWSWACLDGVVHNFGDQSYFPKPLNRDQYSFRTRMLSHSIDLSIPSAPYGAVQSGHLLLRGALRVPDSSIGVPRHVITDPGALPRHRGGSSIHGDGIR